MKCPFCGCEESKVVDSRPADDNERIRRRRECLKCQKRFTTYEAVEMIPVMVVKKNGSIQPFNREKLLDSMLHACEKRKVSLASVEKAVNEIEAELQNSMEREIPTSRIGEMAMEKLMDIDQAAYVRFASVYRSFKDIETFMEELRLLQEKNGLKKD